GAREADRGHGRHAMAAPQQQGNLPLAHRLLPDPDRQHRGPARPPDRTDPLFHGPRGGRPFPRRGARPAPLPNLRTPPRRAAPVDADRAAVIQVSVRRASKMFGWWMRGLTRPTPFFDDSTNAPCSAPRVLTRSERAAL